MMHLLNNFSHKILSVAKSLLVAIIFFFLCMSVSAQSHKSHHKKHRKQIHPEKYRTAQTVATITYNYSSKYSTYVKISYLGRTHQFNYFLRGYEVGDKLMVAYDPKNISNVALILEKPYFEKGELSDTTEGVLKYIDRRSVVIVYRIYKTSDSMEVTIQNKYRYISKRMFDTLKIKENYLYKIIYNKKSGRAEVLFNEIIDNTHLQRNKHRFIAFQHIYSSHPIDGIRSLTECIRVDQQNDFYYYFQRGKLLEKIREYKNALEDFTRYIESKPRDQRGYVQRATAYIHMKNLEAAQKDVTTLFSLDGLNPEAYYLQGVIYCHRKEYQKAIDSYSNAILHAKGLNLEVYYYDRAQARKKLYGKKDKEYKDDYHLSKTIAIKNDASKMRGPDTHQENLQHISHGCYVTITSDNSLTFNSALQSNMQVELIVPYTTNNNTTATYDQTFSLNRSKNAATFSLGLGSIEFGAYKRIYGRGELNTMPNDGFDSQRSFRSVVGYNMKFTKNDVMILRPEMGFTVFNRIVSVGTIDFNGASQITIMGTNFNYHTTKDKSTDKIDVSLNENVLSLSPAIGLWLFPYSSKFVMRVSLGYNYVFSQKYNFLFSSNNGKLREQPDHVNLKLPNTYAGNTNFFSYRGLFINVGIGIRF